MLMFMQHYTTGTTLTLYTYCCLWSYVAVFASTFVSLLYSFAWSETCNIYSCMTLCLCSASLSFLSLSLFLSRMTYWLYLCIPFSTISFHTHNKGTPPIFSAFFFEEYFPFSLFAIEEGNNT